MPNQKEILATISIIALAAILFSPANSDIWRIPFVLGIGTGLFYFFKK